MTRRRDIRRTPKRAGLAIERAIGLGLGLALAAAAPASAQTAGQNAAWDVGQRAPSLNFYGATGLIDMPSGEAQPDGQISATVSHFGGITRTTLSFQITKRLSGSFRYAGSENLNFFGFDTYYDRSFDLRYRVLDEGRYMPAITVGLQDFVGTGLYSAEYIAATKHLRPDLKVTAGLGWGRLGSYGDIGQTGDRPPVTPASIGTGGEPAFDQWFRGPVAPFFGVEWQATDRLGLKLEYSSDVYDLEDRRRGIIDRKSPWNVGLEYQLTDGVRLGAYYLYGSEFGVSAQIAFNPKRPPNGSGLERGGLPIAPRPDRAANPDAWDTDWTQQADAPSILRQNVATLLEAEGIQLEALELQPYAVTAQIRNRRFDAPAQAVGRTARVLAQTMPASIETFTVVPLARGIPASSVTLKRTELERNEHGAGGTAAMLASADIGPGGLLANPEDRLDGLYPGSFWAIGPYTRAEFFDPDNPVRLDVGVQARGRVELAPGFVLSGAVRQKLTGNLDASGRTSNSVLPHVRSDYVLYNKAADDGPTIPHLTAAYYTGLGQNLYGRLTVGYLERMYGGVSAEVLWKPVDSRLAFGVEANYVKQRDYDQLFGFRDYDVATGHVSAYYEIGNGYHAQLDVGRYLAGDVGATLSLDREFDNGWKVGAFATLTDVSFDDFGEGSFDKGIRFTVPLSWLLGRPSRASYSSTIRPVTRDGGARLEVDGRLYDTVRDYDRDGLVAEWGRFWR